MLYAKTRRNFKVRLPVKKVCKLFTMSYEVLTRDYSVRFWRSKCPGIQSFQHFNLLKFCTRNYAPLESSDLHAPGTSDLIGFSVPCILPTMLCFFVLISSATFILKKKNHFTSHLDGVGRQNSSFTTHYTIKHCNQNESSLHNARSKA